MFSVPLKEAFVNEKDSNAARYAAGFGLECCL